jgi:hypothetical protein
VIDKRLQGQDEAPGVRVNARRREGWEDDGSTKDTEFAVLSTGEIEVAPRVNTATRAKSRGGVRRSNDRQDIQLNKTGRHDGFASVEDTAVDAELDVSKGSTNALERRSSVDDDGLFPSYEARGINHSILEVSKLRVSSSEVGRSSHAFVSNVTDEGHVLEDVASLAQAYQHYKKHGSRVILSIVVLGIIAGICLYACQNFSLRARFLPEQSESFQRRDVYRCLNLIKARQDVQGSKGSIMNRKRFGPRSGPRQSPQDSEDGSMSGSRATTSWSPYSEGQSALTRKRMDSCESTSPSGSLKYAQGDADSGSTNSLSDRGLPT